MKICENGVIREMTQGEIEEIKRLQEECEAMPLEETQEEKVQRLENEVNTLTDCILEMSTLLYQ